MATVIPTVGTNLYAQGPPTITKVEIKIGTLTAGQRYDATVDRTALVDTSPVTFSIDRRDISAASGTRQWNLAILRGEFIGAGTEAGVFLNDVLFVLTSDASQDLFVQGPEDETIIAFRVAFVNGLPVAVSITVLPIVRSTIAEAIAGVRHDVFITPYTLDAAITDAINNLDLGIDEDAVNRLIATYVDDNRAFASSAEARRGAITDKVMSPGTTTDHHEARIKIQDADPTTGDAALQQVWLVP